MSGGAKYSIGPLTTYADPDELKRWFRDAAPGHEYKYATGPALMRYAEAPRLARALADAGGAELFQRRNGRGFDYVIRKRAARAAPAAAAAQATAIDDGARRLLAVLADLAGQRRACPSYTRLAELADLPDRYAARYRLIMLEKAGLARIDGQRMISLPQEAS